MTTQDSLGGFQQLVMLAVLRLSDEAYGARMQRELEETAGRSVSISTVYVTMDRLERKGLIVKKAAVNATTVIIRVNEIEITGAKLSGGCSMSMREPNNIATIPPIVNNPKLVILTSKMKRTMATSIKSSPA